jgi:hypothetical protein
VRGAMVVRRSSRGSSRPASSPPGIRTSSASRRSGGGSPARRRRGRWLNLSLVGPVALTALFQGSTRLTEEISARKYPAYVEYQERTSRLFPWPQSRRAGRGARPPVRTS